MFATRKSSEDWISSHGAFYIGFRQLKVREHFLFMLMSTYKLKSWTPRGLYLSNYTKFTLGLRALIESPISCFTNHMVWNFR